MRPTLLFVVLMFVAMVSPAWAQVSALAAIDQELRAHFPKVTSIKAVELEKLMGSKLRPIVIDVWEPEEFAVSRLQGAVRIDPDAELDDVLRAIGPELEDRIIIVYCSVGVRSTELAERVGGGLKSRGVSQIANLSKGIFGWHNATRTLMRGTQKTPYVDPL